jgi:hypothetical protein
MAVSSAVALESVASSFRASTFRIELETGNSLETTGVNIVVENEALSEMMRLRNSCRREFTPLLQRLRFRFSK